MIDFFTKTKTITLIRILLLLPLIALLASLSNLIQFLIILIIPLKVINSIIGGLIGALSSIFLLLLIDRTLLNVLDMMQLFLYIEYTNYTNLTFIDICKRIIKALTSIFNPNSCYLELNDNLIYANKKIQEELYNSVSEDNTFHFLIEFRNNYFLQLIIDSLTNNMLISVFYYVFKKDTDLSIEDYAKGFIFYYKVFPTLMEKTLKTVTIINSIATSIYLILIVALSLTSFSFLSGVILMFILHKTITKMILNAYIVSILEQIHQMNCKLHAPVNGDSNGALSTSSPLQEETSGDSNGGSIAASLDLSKFSEELSSKFKSSSNNSAVLSNLSSLAKKMSADVESNKKLNTDKKSTLAEQIKNGTLNSIKAQNKDFSSMLHNWDSTSSNNEEVKRVEHKQFTLDRKIMNKAVNASTPNNEEKDKTEKILNTDLFKIENHLQTLTELHIEFILNTGKILK